MMDAADIAFVLAGLPMGACMAHGLLSLSDEKVSGLFYTACGFAGMVGLMIMMLGR